MTNASTLDHTTAALRAATTRTQAREALAGLKVAELRQVAAAIREGGLTVIGRPTGDNLRTAIVEYTTGRAADSRAINRAVNY